MDIDYPNRTVEFLKIVILNFVQIFIFLLKIHAKCHEFVKKNSLLYSLYRIHYN